MITHKCEIWLTVSAPMRDEKMAEILAAEAGTIEWSEVGFGMIEFGIRANFETFEEAAGWQDSKSYLLDFAVDIDLYARTAPVEDFDRGEYPKDYATYHDGELTIENTWQILNVAENVQIA